MLNRHYWTSSTSGMMSGDGAKSMPSSSNNRSEVRKELIESLLALPDVEYLTLPSSPKHEWSFIALSGAPAARRRSRPFECYSRVTFLVAMYRAITQNAPCSLVTHTTRPVCSPKGLYSAAASQS